MKQIKKLSKWEKECFVTIHQICGDCGRRIKMKLMIPESEDKDGAKSFIAILKLYSTKYNMACDKCSMDTLPDKFYTVKKEPKSRTKAKDVEVIKDGKTKKRK
jgi:hypothetical protein